MQWLPKGDYDGSASLDAFVALGAMARSWNGRHVGYMHVAAVSGQLVCRNGCLSISGWMVRGTSLSIEILRVN